MDICVVQLLSEKNRGQYFGPFWKICVDLKTYLCFYLYFFYRLPKAEVISHVIDYIHDLRETLGLPPCIKHQDNNDDDYLMMTVSTAGTTGVPLSDRPSNVLPLGSTSSMPCSISSNSNRQPFGVILNPRTIWKYGAYWIYSILW